MICRHCLGLALVVISGLGCYGRPPAGDPVVCGDGVCERDRGERCARCPIDCCVACDPAATSSASTLEYVVREIRFPADATETCFYSRNLDGDRGADNYDVLSLIQRLINYGTGLNEHLAEQVAAGELLLAVRLHADGLDEDDEVVFSILHGAVREATPLFDGQDRISLAPTASPEAYACGLIEGGVLYAGPAAMDHVLPLPLPFVDEPLRSARLLVDGVVADPERLELTVAMGLYADEVREIVVPGLARFITREIAADPESQAAGLLAAFLDGKCNPEYEGCEHTVNGQGECDDQAEPAVITATELWCAIVMQRLQQPNMDVDGDGEPDLVGFGYRISAVRARIVE